MHPSCRAREQDIAPVVMDQCGVRRGRGVPIRYQLIPHRRRGGRSAAAAAAAAAAGDPYPGHMTRKEHKF